MIKHKKVKYNERFRSSNELESIKGNLQKLPFEQITKRFNKIKSAKATKSQVLDLSRVDYKLDELEERFRAIMANPKQ